MANEKEYDDLLYKYNALLKSNRVAVNDLATKECKRYELRKDNVWLREKIKELKILPEHLKAENVQLRELLEQSQMEIERLNDEWELVVKRDLG